ncbi:hypothetical protein [Cohnella faecalis]|uniref:hypothetical protein n=1 Tax=Cohnella faecalis TaxID=2315694 RepID=UPI0011C22498|nr:hypothetical protein [Cohnella faecalis]
MALSQAVNFFDWTFPVITETGGQVTYSANIRFKDGTFEEVPTTVSDRNTIMLGDVALTRVSSSCPI